MFELWPAVGVVACCGRKLAEPAPAKELYQSLLFRLSRQYVERRCPDWVILSAKYGVVRPDQVIAPYDLSLRDLSASERQEWAQRCNAQLRQMFPEEMYVVLAGKLYRAALDALPASVPMVHLGIGQQIAWLQRDLEIRQ